MTPETPPSETALEQPAPRTSLLGRLLVAAFMGAVIVGQCLFAYVWIPSAEEVAARAETRNREAAEAEQHGLDEQPRTDGVIEVDLGQYTVTAHQPSANTTLRIDFHLFGTVLEKDRREFENLFANTQHRLRDTIIFEVRNSEVPDLTDPGLALIKRRILEKSNRLFGKSVLRSIVFSNYSLYEQ